MLNCRGDRLESRWQPRGSSHRSRSSVRRPGHSRPERSSACGRSNDDDGTCDGSTSGRNHSSVPEHSKRARERSRWLRSTSERSSACGGSSDHDGTCDGSTSGRSSSSAPGRSRWARQHNTRAPAHNTKAHSNHRGGGRLPLARRRAQTGRQTTAPAKQYGISWTELLNRKLGDSTCRPLATTNCLWRIFLRNSGRLCSDSLTLSPWESLAVGYRRPKWSVLVCPRISPNLPRPRVRLGGI